MVLPFSHGWWLMSRMTASHLGFAVAVAGMLALTACSDPVSAPTVPHLRAVLGQVPTTPSPRPGIADEEYVEICVNVVGPGQPPDFFKAEFVVDPGATGKYTQGYHVQLAPNSC